MLREMKVWKDLTPEEKGALLLAYHEGKVIRWYSPNYPNLVDSTENGYKPNFLDNVCYWIKPDPVVTEESCFAYVNSGSAYFSGYMSDPTHKITFNIVDGEPDCTSVKMEKI